MTGPSYARLTPSFEGQALLEKTFPQKGDSGASLQVALKLGGAISVRKADGGSQAPRAKRRGRLYYALVVLAESLADALSQSDVVAIWSGD